MESLRLVLQRLPNRRQWLHITRSFSEKVSADGGVSHNANTEWRKKMLNKLESKFASTKETEIAVAPSVHVSSDDELQSNWREMEGRVKHRKPLTKEQRGSKVGRMNIRKTDEDVWLEKGMYEGSNKK